MLMAGKNKLMKFAQVETFENVLQPNMDEFWQKDYKLKGNWKKEYFKNENPIVLELGCGKGEYTVALAKRNSDKSFIGIDIKGNRIWLGAKQCIEMDLTNACFVRTKIDFIQHFFAENEVDEIWLTFSDPQPKRPRKRLTSDLFLARYEKLLVPNGVIHVKTDSDLMYESTLEQIERHNLKIHFNCSDLYNELNQFDKETQELLSTKTHYENLFVKKGHIVKYLSFSF